MRATLTTRGMYNIYDVLFDGLNVPEGMVKQVAVDNILSTTDGLETLYPNPPMLASLISQWSSVMRPIWAKLFETTQYQYEPIYNYDRTEEHTMSGSDVHNTDTTVTDQSTTEETQEETVAGTANDQTTTEETQEETASGTGKETPTGTEKQKTSENVAAFNTDSASVPATATETEISFTDRETQKTTNTTTNRENTSETSGTKTTNTTTNRENVSETSGTKTTKDKLEMQYGKKETVRAFGNIGVTTTQQMIQSEREVVQFSVYQAIADDFKQRFCIMVY